MSTKFLRAILLCIVGAGLNCITAQNISGVVIDRTTKEPLVGVAVVVKAAANSEVLAYSISTNTGSFSINIPPEKLDKGISMQSINIEASRIGYEKFSKTLTKKDLVSDMLLEINLTEQLEDLETILIEAKRDAVTIKNDTTTYRVQNFADGTERNVEDLIKKLPGMTVDASGSISYKGAPIKKLLIEGDDLFDENYTVGSRNITADALERIEAIENWNENELLKGFSSQEGVAINLKLKKGYAGLTANTDIGLGHEERYKGKLNLLGISTKFKSFTTGSLLNTGDNDSPYNLMSYASSLRDQSISPFTSNVVLEDIAYLSPLSNKQQFKNKQQFYSGSAHVRLGKKAKLQISTDYYKDFVAFTNASAIRFTTGDEPISNDNNLSKKPSIFGLNSNLSWKTSASNILNLDVIYRDKNVITQNDLLANNQFDIFSNQSLKGRFFTLNGENTYKLNVQDVLISKLVVSTDLNNESLFITPEINILNDQVINITSNNLQRVQVGNNRVLGQVQYLSNISPKNEIELKWATVYGTENLNSNLSSTSQNFANEISLNSFNTWLYVGHIFKLKKWKFNNSIEARLLGFQLDNKIIETKKNVGNFAFLPNLNVQYKPNNINSLSINHGYNIANLQITTLFSDIIQRSARNAVLYDNPNLVFPRFTNTGLTYRRDDIYNQFVVEGNVQFNKSKNDFLPTTVIGQNVGLTSFNIQNTSNQQFLGSIKAEKFINALSTTFKLSYDYNRFEFITALNEGDLRNVASINNNIQGYFKTAFNFPLNIQNTTRISKINFIIDNVNGTDNNRIQNTLVVLYKSKSNFRAQAYYDWWNFDLRRKNNVQLLSASCGYFFKKLNLSLNLELHNIFNTTNLEQAIVTNFENISSSQSLNERFYLLSTSFKF